MRYVDHGIQWEAVMARREMDFFDRDCFYRSTGRCSWCARRNCSFVGHPAGYANLMLALEYNTIELLVFHTLLGIHFFI